PSARGSDEPTFRGQRPAASLPSWLAGLAAAERERSEQRHVLNAVPPDLEEGATAREQPATSVGYAEQTPHAWQTLDQSTGSMRNAPSAWPPRLPRRSCTRIVVGSMRPNWREQRAGSRCIGWLAVTRTRPRSVASKATRPSLRRPSINRTRGSRWSRERALRTGGSSTSSWMSSVPPCSSANRTVRRQRAETFHGIMVADTARPSTARFEIRARPPTRKLDHTSDVSSSSMVTVLCARDERFQARSEPVYSWVPGSVTTQTPRTHTSTVS